MSIHVIVGAGPVGSSLARQLAGSGHDVRVVTRSGSAPRGTTAVRADAADPLALGRAAAGAAVLYNCANPPTYRTWLRDWPPLAASVLSAAEATGAVLVTMSNLYGYGPVDGPITRDHPLAATSAKGRLRADMWAHAHAAHQAGAVRAAEVRASDYIGPGVTENGGLLARYGRAVLAGKPADVIGDPDAPHSWSYVDDVARTLAAVGATPAAWGQAWHAPTNPAAPVREVLAALAARTGSTARVRRLPRWQVRTLGLVMPVLRELDELMYQFDRPFVMDAAATEAALDLRATSWDAVLDATAAGWAPAGTRLRVGDDR